MKTVEKPTASDLFFRTFPALSGALIGSILSLGFFIFLRSAMGGNEEAPLAFSKFLLFAVIFVSAISANVLSVTFQVLANREDFHGKLRDALMSIFFLTVGLFALCSPFFLFLSIEASFSLATFFFPFSAISTALLYELYANPQQNILAAYKSIFSGFMVAGIFALIFQGTENRPPIIPEEMMAFFALPIAWIVIPSISLLVQTIWALVHNHQNTTEIISEKNPASPEYYSNLQ